MCEIPVNFFTGETPEVYPYKYGGKRFDLSNSLI
jgi:hypothetical protein